MDMLAAEAPRGVKRKRSGEGPTPPNIVLLVLVSHGADDGVRRAAFADALVECGAGRWSIARHARPEVLGAIVERELAAGRSVVIDRPNADRFSRLAWADLAALHHGILVAALEFSAAPGLAAELSSERLFTEVLSLGPGAENGLEVLGRALALGQSSGECDEGPAVLPFSPLVPRAAAREHGDGRGAQAVVAKTIGLHHQPSAAGAQVRGATMRRCKMYCDGASRGNPGPGSAGCVLVDADTDEVLISAGWWLGDPVTNNFAEYTALVRGLQLARDHQVAEKLQVFADSLLMVKQISGEYRVKAETLAGLHAEARALLTKCSGQLFHVSIRGRRHNPTRLSGSPVASLAASPLTPPSSHHQVPRAQNAQADAAANRALDARADFVDVRRP
jgi:ribonuclease HI